MPKFYPNQQIIDDIFAKWIYDEYKSGNDIPLPAIKNRKKYLEMVESFKIISEFKDTFHSEQKIRDKAIEMLDKLQCKYNKEDYPELWI